MDEKYFHRRESDIAVALNIACHALDLPRAEFAEYAMRCFWRTHFPTVTTMSPGGRAPDLRELAEGLLAREGFTKENESGEEMFLAYTRPSDGTGLKIQLYRRGCEVYVHLLQYGRYAVIGFLKGDADALCDSLETFCRDSVPLFAAKAPEFYDMKKREYRVREIMAAAARSSLVPVLGEAGFTEDDWSFERNGGRLTLTAAGRNFNLALKEEGFQERLEGMAARIRRHAEKVSGEPGDR